MQALILLHQLHQHIICGKTPAVFVDSGEVVVGSVGQADVETLQVIAFLSQRHFVLLGFPDTKRNLPSSFADWMRPNVEVFARSD